MSRLVRVLLLLQLAWLGAASACAQTGAINGKWNVTASFANGSSAAEMTLTQTGEAIEGTSGPLDENRYFPVSLKGKVTSGAAELDVTRGADPVGKLSVSVRNGALTGQGGRQVSRPLPRRLIIA